MMLLGPFERPGAALALPVTGTYALSGVLVAAAGLALAQVAEQISLEFATSDTP